MHRPTEPSESACKCEPRRPRRCKVSTITAALWPVGIALTSWHYMWRTTPMHRSEERGSVDDRPPRLADELVDEDVRGIEEGVGPLFHRIYRARIRDARLSPDELIDRLSADP